MSKEIKASQNRTSSFGVKKRENFDSSEFYKRKMYGGLTLKNYDTEAISDNVVDKKYINKIINHTSEKMSELPDNTVHLMITSPPYNVGKEYDEDLDFENYLSFLRKVWEEVYRVLVIGGRIAINVANLGRKPYIPLHAFIIKDLLEIGFLMRGEIIWNKGSSAGISTAWGSWKSASNPVLRDIHEYILIFSKGTFQRKKDHSKKSTISKDEFVSFTKSIWDFPAVSAKKIGHPAPFPIELPYRIIQLFSFEGDIVLDPFMGSGQTALACIKTKRKYIGYEINKEYKELAEKRIREFRIEMNEDITRWF